MNRNLWSVSIAFALAVTLFLSLGLTGSAQFTPQVVVLIGGVSISDLLERDLPFIKEKALHSGAIALLNNRTAAAYSPENCYASLASGARTQAPANVRLFQALDELTDLGSGESLFQRYYSLDLPTSEGFALSPGFMLYRGALTRAQAQAKYPVQHGLIAQTLSTRKYSPAFIGAGDSLTGLQRSGTLLAMQPTGIVTATDFSGVLKPDEAYPGGVRTDYQGVITKVQTALTQCLLVFVETGDLLRLYEETDVMEASILQRWKTRSLGEIDRFLADLSEALSSTVQFWLVSAYPAKDAYRSGNPITFLATWGADAPTGLLTSSTTRRAGLITNTDFAPSILQAFGLSAPAAYGAPIRAVAWEDDRLTYLEALNRRWVKVNSARSPYLKAYVLSQIVVVATSALLLLFFRPTSRAYPLLAQVVQSFCIAETCFPLTLLVFAVFAPSPFLFWLVVIIPLSIGILAVMFKRVILAFTVTCLTTAYAIVSDTVLGWGLGANSLLGYDPIGGARFYGIGNEYMGVLVGSFFLGWSLVRLSTRARWVEIVSLATGLVCLTVLGSPRWGANVGGTIGFAAALATWVLSGRSQRFRLRHIIYSIALLVTTLGVFVLWDLRFNPEVSHLGQFALNVAHNGISEAWNVFKRKLTMNWKLLHYTIWADGLVTFVAGLALAFWKPRGLAKMVYEQYPQIIRGLWTALAGAVTVFAANDSGVVAAATLMIYPSFLLLSVALDLNR